MKMAASYRERAYAPYSRFAVGAALLMRDGSVFGGCNVENASYGLAICAERAAMTSAIAAGKRDPLAIAVSGSGDIHCPPCGACRQFLIEFNPEMEIFLMKDGRVVSLNLANLLPHRFILEDR